MESQQTRESGHGLSDSIAIVALAITLLTWALAPTTLEKIIAMGSVVGMVIYLAYRSHWTRRWRGFAKFMIAAISVAGVLTLGWPQIESQMSSNKVSEDARSHQIVPAPTTEDIIQALQEKEKKDADAKQAIVDRDECLHADKEYPQRLRDQDRIMPGVNEARVNLTRQWFLPPKVGEHLRLCNYAVNIGNERAYKSHIFTGMFFPASTDQDSVPSARNIGGLQGIMQFALSLDKSYGVDVGAGSDEREVGVSPAVLTADDVAAFQRGDRTLMILRVGFWEGKLQKRTDWSLCQWTHWKNFPSQDIDWTDCTIRDGK